MNCINFVVPMNTVILSGLAACVLYGVGAGLRSILHHERAGENRYYAYGAGCP